MQSALDQTWSNKEVIVIDDGSTDGSLEVIKSFGNKIHWETGPNRGGNHARNRGFALSKGECIQFLDADDYLLPPKIERQVKAFKETNADVVYEDWQRLAYDRDGSSKLLPVEISGRHEDILEALLAGWAPPPCAFLFNRKVIEGVSGWNEELTSAQDWELHIRIAIAGLDYRYVPGCHSVYRRPPMPTVSIRDARWSSEKVLSKYHENVYCKKIQVQILGKKIGKKCPFLDTLNQRQ